MKQRPGIFEKYLWVIWYADVILLWRPNLIFLSESCWWCSWHKRQIKWALAPKSIVIALHGLSWDVTSILQTGLVATRSLKSRPKIKIRESSTQHNVSYSSSADVKLDTIQTLWFCPFYCPPTSDFKGNNQRIFHWRTSCSWQISCFLYQGSMRNVIKQRHLSRNQLSTPCFTDSLDLFSNSSPFYDEMRATQTKKQNISLFSRVWLENIFWFWYWGWATVVCHDLEWKTSDKPTDLPLPTSWLAWVVPGPTGTARSSVAQ